MITIVKEGHTIKCSNNTYKSMYKRLGYEIVENSKVEQPKIVEKTKEIIVEDEIPVV